eukprot:7984871-Karenia_brevis.AAC.1
MGNPTRPPEMRTTTSFQDPISVVKGRICPPQWGTTKYERVEKQVWDVMESMKTTTKFNGIMS